MKNERLQNALAAISKSRNQKYNEEIDRQKALVEENLFKFMEGQQAAMDGLKRANRNYQTMNYIWFEMAMDAAVLPEVAAYIKEEYGIEVDERDERRIFAQYQA